MALQLSPAGEYFVSYWFHITGKQKRDIMELSNSFNPRVVVQELLDEILLNNLRNKENKEFFQRLIAQYAKDNLIVGRRLEVPLSEIAREIQHFEKRPAYLTQLCRRALREFEELVFFKDSILLLLDFLSETELTEQRRKDIRSIANRLVVEFRALGYGNEDINKIMKDCFSSITHIEKNVIWDFPHKIKAPDASRSEIELWDHYTEQLKIHEQNLSEADRIKALEFFAEEDKREYSFIFKCFGLRGQFMLEVGNVTFYSPSVKKFLPESDNNVFADETFNDKKNEVVNAHVTVTAASSHAGEVLAKVEIQNSFADLRTVFRNCTPFRLSESCICYSDGKYVRGSYHAFDTPGSKWIDDTVLNAARATQVGAALSGLEKLKDAAKTGGWGRRLREALFWLRRADESETPVEQFLANWISIETLCSKASNAQNWFETKDGAKESDITLIREVAAKMYAIAKAYHQCWVAFYWIKDSDFTNIPQELGIRAGLLADAGPTRSIGQFVESLTEIEPFLSDSLLKEHVAKLLRFFDSPKAASETLENFVQLARDELLYLYRMRNKIAHDGNASHPMLETLCALAKSYALTVFNAVRKRGEADPASGLDGYLIDAVQQYETLQRRLREKDESPRKVFFDVGV